MVKRRLKTVDEILGSLEPEKKTITEKVRCIVRNTIPNAAEMVRRGRITYGLNDQDFLSIRNDRSQVRCFPNGVNPIGLLGFLQHGYHVFAACLAFLQISSKIK
jgi:hypothetical protein